MLRTPSRKTLVALGVVILLLGLVGVLAFPHAHVDAASLSGAGTASTVSVTWYVAAAGSDPGNCPAGGNTVSTPFATIGFALGCAASDNTTASLPDLIQVAAGTYNEAHLFVNAYVTIDGVQGKTTIDGQQAATVLTIQSPYIVTISGLTIQNGLGVAGGGIRNLGTLTLIGTTVSNNTSNCCGAGIANLGTLTLKKSTVSGNIAGDHAGGIDNDGTMTLEQSTVTGNSAGFAGGILNYIGSTASISNSRISDNSGCSSTGCNGGGGGIFNFNGATLTITNSTLSGNTGCNASGCVAFGGGIFNDSGSHSVALTNDIIKSNVAYSGPGSSGDGGGLFNNTGSPTLNGDAIKDNKPNNCAGSLTC
jgi:hypothetical protein